MKPVCRYPHSTAAMPTRQGLPPPALVGIRNGSGRCIAWQCPVCLRTWQALAPGIGKQGTELVPMDPRERRRAMMEASDQCAK